MQRTSKKSLTSSHLNYRRQKENYGLQVLQHLDLPVTLLEAGVVYLRLDDGSDIFLSNTQMGLELLPGLRVQDGE